MPEVKEILHAIANCETVPRVGRVSQYYGMAVESVGPDVFLGELCHVYPPSQLEPVVAEVVGFRDGKVMLMPYGNLNGVHVGSEIIATGKAATVPVGAGFVGRVIDAFGEPLDDEDSEIEAAEHYPLYPDPINPLHREPIREVLETGVGVVDSFLTVGKGQRMGIFAGSGVGKSTLLGMLARSSQAEINVIALIGERGREVIDFIESNLGAEGLQRSIVVVAGADQPALVRTRAAFAATAIAEYFRNQGSDVMLAMDSVTRFAMAQREIGLAIGEPPTARGYTPSSFSILPKLLERAGNFKTGGSITAFYTVLVEGDDFNEPVTDNLRAILDGHIVLARKIANQGQFPAVSMLESISRLHGAIASQSHQKLIRELLRLFSIFEDSKDMIDMGVYESGQNPDIDSAIKVVPEVNRLLRQDSTEVIDLGDLMLQLNNVVNSATAVNRGSNQRSSGYSSRQVRTGAGQ